MLIGAKNIADIAENKENIKISLEEPG